jgi:hypothetical protein
MQKTALSQAELIPAKHCSRPRAPPDPHPHRFFSLISPPNCLLSCPAPPPPPLPMSTHLRSSFLLARQEPHRAPPPRGRLRPELVPAPDFTKLPGPSFPCKDFCLPSSPDLRWILSGSPDLHWILPRRRDLHRNRPPPPLARHTATGGSGQPQRRQPPLRRGPLIDFYLFI